ncbi:MAG: leucine-rich repeat domain-containing protein [Salinivirgaceae bacterium]|nr:leucine-rich repeat domain-containing protein [Salinivirgaceae bacterium]
MKKFLFVIVAAMFAGQAWAADNFDFSAVCESGQTLYYKITSNTEPYSVKVTYPNKSGDNYYNGYTKPTGSLDIPTKVTYPEPDGITYVVTDIADYAFYNCSGLTSVNIPDGVIGIGQYAFSSCFEITSITIGNDVTNIGNNAFQICNKLTSVNIPDNVTSIGQYAFYSCSNLVSVAIGNGVTNIGEWAFGECNKLKSIDLSENLTSISNSLFYGCRGLTSITIPDGVTSIGCNAFDGCTGLTSITIPNSVTSIGSWVFHGCTGLTSITIPDGVTTISDSFFYECSNLSSIILGNSVTTIESAAFGECHSLTSINIPASVTSIGDRAFLFCSSLTSIAIPDGVTGIAPSTFMGCGSLESITIPEALQIICEGAFCGSGLTSITIPDGIKSIENETFSGCSSLTSVILPASVASIGEYAFAGIGSVSITIPGGVTSIGRGAFLDCQNLTSIVIPDGVKYIDESTFQDCSSLTSVTLPDGIVSIGRSSFAFCSNLSITIPDGIATIEEGAFIDTKNIVYGGNLSGRPWGAVTSGVSIDENGFVYADAEKTRLAAYVGNAQSVTIPGTVISIGKNAFKNCNNLNSIVIPDRVTSIGGSAFYDCSGLTSITIPESVTSIGEYAFKNCQNATLYCQAESKPLGWNGWWNPDYRPVNWNCKVIKLTVNNPEQGSAEVSGYAVKTADGSMWYLYNSQAVFSATPNNGCHVQWEDGGTDNNRTITITENKTYTATFETHTPVDVAKLEATCTTNGHEAGKCCSVCNAVLEGMDVIPALNHVFGTPAYVWSEDGSSCTATVVCQRDASHVETENASISSAVTVAATCEEGGITTYTATFTNELFATQTKAVDISPLNHRYGTPKYVWSEDGSSCTATAVCQHNASHVVSESAIITNEVTIPATCDERGTTTYTATFENTLFTMQTKDIDDIPANGHIEVVEEAVAPTCTDMGKTEGKYCSVCGKVLVEQEDIAPLDHNYGEPSYEWSEDGRRCTATAVCQRDANHVMTENATIFIINTTAATCEREGSTTYMAEFGYELFEPQINTAVDAPALGHNYLLPIYAWSANGGSCTAMAICLRDANHTITEKATITSEVTIAATCEGMGATTHTASFENEVFESQTKVVVDIPAQGHTMVVDDAVEPTCESFGLTEGSHCSVCGHVFKAQNILPALPHTEVVDEAVEPTCTIAGKTEGKHCAVCGTVLQAQERIPAWGHTVDIDLAVPATCTVTGKTDGRHCSVCNTVLVAQKEVPALGHEFVNYVYNNDATTTADGTETAKCEHGCGVTDTRTAAGTKLAETPEKGTAVAESAANAVNIYAYGNTIVVENATNEISVYNAMGTLICRNATPCVRAEINVGAPGVYIVKTGSVAKRVLVSE